MEALANTEPLMRELMHYRFTEGSLAGQSFGNLFLAALNGISPSFDAAVARMSEVLAITGRVLPVTTADVQLKAFFENGASVVGESKIFYCKKREDCRITRVRLVPEHPRALPEALTAIRDADVLLLGPGSRYTVSDHIQALFQHAAPGLFQVCLANSSPIPREVAARYASEGAEPLQCDVRTCAALGVEVVRRPMAVVEDGYVRHHPDALARELILLHAERSVRIAGSGARDRADAYRMEHQK